MEDIGLFKGIMGIKIPLVVILLCLTWASGEVVLREGVLFNPPTDVEFISEFHEVVLMLNLSETKGIVRKMLREVHRAGTFVPALIHLRHPL